MLRHYRKRYFVWVGFYLCCESISILDEYHLKAIRFTKSQLFNLIHFFLMNFYKAEQSHSPINWLAEETVCSYSICVL